MLYSQNVKNMVSGISQQPPIMRLPEQLAEQINGFSTEMSGLQKRPPTSLVTSLAMAGADTAEPLVHFVHRDENEKYIMYFYNNTVRIFDLDGNEKTVNVDASAAAYLESLDPRNDFRVITIADYTFVVNRNVVCSMRDTQSTIRADNPPRTYNGFLIHVKQGQYGRTYQVRRQSETLTIASFTTPDGSSAAHTSQIDTNYIVQKLADSAISYGYSVKSGSSWLYIYGGNPPSPIDINNTEDKWSTRDGFNNQAMIGIADVVQKFSLLPASAPDGYVVRVMGDPNGNNSGSYYVKYDATAQVWKETVKEGIPVKLDAVTMPHVLVRESDGTFTFRAAEWGERAIGDEEMNPEPSFVGHPINDIFFFRNRLGFLSGENVILSESAEYFNFFMTTANDVKDTDPIDLATTTSSINILNYAVPFNEELYCFSDSTQFILRSDTTLSPKNCALVNTTGFNSFPRCRPVVCGKNLYFPSSRAEYTSIMEYYYVQSATEMLNAQDISAHVASYIPNDVYEIIPSTNENLMLFLTDGDRDGIYIYKYLFQNEQRVQASWSRWDMGGSVFGAAFIGSTLYVLVNRGGQHVLEKMLFTYNTKDFDEEPYRAFLDCKTQAQTKTYDEAYDKTAIHLDDIYPWYAASRCSFGVLLQDGTYKTFTHDEVVANNGVIIMEGNHVAEPVIVGIPYTFHIQFSPVYLRQKDENNTLRAVVNGRLQVRDLKLNYADTGGFVVHVKSHGHTYTYPMTARHLGTTTLGKIQDETGVFRIPVQCLNTACEITLDSDMPLPVSLLNFVWEGSWAAKAKGV